MVDSLTFTRYEGELDAVFAKGEIIGGAAMLAGSVAGGYIAQISNLGVPYLVRSALLGLTFVAALVYMQDIGFTPARGRKISRQIRTIFQASIENGLKRPAVRWVMLGAPFASGAGFFAFYAMQPYLLEIYGDPQAYGVAGLAAAVIAGAQIAGGLLVKQLRGMFALRTQAMILGTVVSAGALAVIGWTMSFWVAVPLLVVWALVFAAVGPIRQAYLNSIIPSPQRATILSFDSLLGSSGAVFAQPALGRVADVWSYSASYLVAALVQLGALPFDLLARRREASSDPTG